MILYSFATVSFEDMQSDYYCKCYYYWLLFGAINTGGVTYYNYFYYFYYYYYCGGVIYSLVLQYSLTLF